MKHLLFIALTFSYFISNAQTGPSRAQFTEAYEELGIQTSFLMEDLNEEAMRYLKNFEEMMFELQYLEKKGETPYSAKEFRKWHGQAMEIGNAAAMIEQLTDSLGSGPLNDTVLRSFAHVELPDLCDNLLRACKPLVKQGSKANLSVYEPLVASSNKLRNKSLSKFEVIHEIQIVYILVVRLKYCSLRICWGNSPARLD